MERIIDVAQYLYDEYHRETGETIDELKLHKLLYFVQRESLAITDEPLFSEPFEGWVHGPVSIDVRKYYDRDLGMNTKTNDISSEAKRIVNNILQQYGHIASWKLRDMSHSELSWKNSRRGLSERDRGNKDISIDDIREDSKKVRPFDYTWGMYYDEFEDAEKEDN